MRAGEIAALLIHGVNPAYSLPATAGFADALKRVPFVASLSDRADETARLADVIAPSRTTSSPGTTTSRGPASSRSRSPPSRLSTTSGPSRRRSSPGAAPESTEPLGARRAHDRAATRALARGGLPAFGRGRLLRSLLGARSASWRQLHWRLQTGRSGVVRIATGIRAKRGCWPRGRRADRA